MSSPPDNSNEPDDTSDALEEKLAEARRALSRGQLVCFPTETGYGLAARIDSTEALAALRLLKGRADDSPFALIVSDLDAARALASPWPARAQELATAHWPGPLTLVVPARPGLAPEITGPLGVGVRVSSHAWAAALANDGPITATSANPAKLSPALTVAQALEWFGDAVSVYLDDGPAPASAASTVVHVAADGSTRVLRKGPLALPRLD